MTTLVERLLEPGEPRRGVHVRQHRSLLAAHEKRVLIWMAERLPARVHSDHLSALGFVSMLGVGLAFAAARWAPTTTLPLVPVFLFLNWFGDSLDGTVARVRCCQRPRYGYYVDHVLDLAGSVFLLVGLAVSGFMHPLVALALSSAYLLVSAETYLATHARGVFKMSCLGWGPTELRILIAIGALWLLRGGWVNPFGLPPQRLFDVAGTIAVVALGLMFVVTASRNVMALYREETNEQTGWRS